MKANLLLFLALVLGHGIVFAESNSPNFAVVIPDGLQAVPRVGDFWLRGEFQRMLEEKKRERGQKPN